MPNPFRGFAACSLLAAWRSASELSPEISSFEGIGSAGHDRGYKALWNFQGTSMNLPDPQGYQEMPSSPQIRGSSMMTTWEWLHQGLG